MMLQDDYDILESDTLEELSEMVNNAIRTGIWIPQGGVCVSYSVYQTRDGEIASQDNYAQAIVRKESK